MKKLLAMLGLSLLVASNAAMAVDVDLSPEQMKEYLSQKFPKAPVTEIDESEMPGFYAVEMGGNLVFVSHDSRFLIQGDAFDISDGVASVNQRVEKVWDKKKSPMRKAEIDKLNEEDMVVYKSPKEEHVITVFTDVDCGYCRKLHKERQNYLDQGITIRYLGFPRSGLGEGSPERPSSGDKLRGIWCAADREKAMTDAKVNRQYQVGRCKTPLAEHLSLVRKFGLSGTPGIITEEGELIGGYQAAEILRQNLDNKRLANEQAAK